MPQFGWSLKGGSTVQSSRRVTFLSPIIEATSLHTHKEKAVTCTVKSCSRIVRHRDIEEHITEAATSNHRLQAGEIQQLHQLISPVSHSLTG